MKTVWCNFDIYKVWEPIGGIDIPYLCTCQIVYHICNPICRTKELPCKRERYILCRTKLDIRKKDSTEMEMKGKIESIFSYSKYTK